MSTNVSLLGSLPPWPLLCCPFQIPFCFFIPTIFGIPWKVRSLSFRTLLLLPCFSDRYPDPPGCTEFPPTYPIYLLDQPPDPFGHAPSILLKHRPPSLLPNSSSTPPFPSCVGASLYPRGKTAVSSPPPWGKGRAAHYFSVLACSPSFNK